MTDRFAGDVGFAAKCYHHLFRGEDTDEAEAAALHVFQTYHLIQESLRKRD